MLIAFFEWFEKNVNRHTENFFSPGAFGRNHLLHVFFFFRLPDQQRTWRDSSTEIFHLAIEVARQEMWLGTRVVDDFFHFREKRRAIESLLTKAGLQQRSIRQDSLPARSASTLCVTIFSIDSADKVNMQSLSTILAKITTDLTWCRFIFSINLL